MTETNKDVLLQSIKTIKALKNKLALYEKNHGKNQQADIAIIGIGCRFPGGVTDLSSYWELLNAGRSGVAEVGADRWSNRQFVDANYDAIGKLVTPYAGLLDNIYDFDAEFFGLSAIEAENLDPQQRLLLEQSWLALEDAGYDITSLRGTDTGVFVGIGSQDYGMALSAEVQHANAYVASGNSLSMAAGRLSYFYDFSGPTLSIDTACSSSLVAVHEACRRLQQQECALALAAGVNAILIPHAGVNFSRARMLTTERDCHVFDARAKGYVRGEGCGVVVLKRLADAQRDGDRIHAVIKSVAINHDGHSSGLTVPNGSAQEAVIRAALQQANLTPGDISYIEAHGTGTSLGDPIEARALAAVFAQSRDSDTPLQVGGVKANLGHLEAAAGIASLIKAALVVGRAKAPPQPGFEQLNPKINWDSQIFRIAQQPSMLTRNGQQPVCAGISNFGFSGTNAHAIVAAPQTTPIADSDKGGNVPEQEVVLALSAKTPSALHQYVEDVVAYFGNQSPETLPDLPALSYTSTLRRVALPERIAVSGRNPIELSLRLQAALLERVSPQRRSRLILALSRHDDLTQLRNIMSSVLVTEPVQQGLPEDVQCAGVHQQLFALLGSFGVYPDSIVLDGIEPAYVQAWLAGTATPATLSYFSSIATSSSTSGNGDIAPVWIDANQNTLSPLNLPAVANRLVLAQRSPRSPDFLSVETAQRQILLEDKKSFLSVLAALFSAGVDIDWSPIFTRKYSIVDDFPKRQFERKTFRSPRVNELLQRNSKVEETRIHPLLHRKIALPSGMLAYTVDTTVSLLDFLDQHRVQGRRFVPASLLIDLMRHAGGDALNVKLAQLSEVNFYHPVDIDLADREYVLQVQQLQGSSSVQQAEAVLSSRMTTTSNDNWTRHASAMCSRKSEQVLPQENLVLSSSAGSDNWQAQDVDALYAQHWEGGVALGEYFRCVKRLRVSGHVLEAEIALDASHQLDRLTRMTILLDGCFQVSGGLPNENKQVYLLASLGKIVLDAELPDVLCVRMEQKASTGGRCFDMQICSTKGRILGSFTDIFFKQLQNAQQVQIDAKGSKGAVVEGIPQHCFYTQQWQQAAWRKPVPVKLRPALLPLTELLQRSDSMLAWAERFDLADYNAYRQQIESVCLKVVADTFRDLGCDNLDITIPDALSQCGIHGTQQKLFTHLFRVLSSSKVQNQGVQAMTYTDLAQLLNAYPQYQSETRFMQHCIAALSDVLVGKRNPLDVLFRDASMAGSDAVYLDSPISRALNSQLAQIAAALGEGRPLRILEVGAGTGGTTRSVLEALRGFPIETYCFTDISPLFLDRAKGLFQGHDFMEYRLLDIEQPVTSQSFERGAYDLVIASNVLHATRFIDQTLRHVRELLVPQGYLLLRECIAPQLSADLSFGMTEGWWRFEDLELRSDYAVISTEQWQQQLLRQVFSEVRIMLPHPLSAEALIVAQVGQHSVLERWLLVHDGQANVWKEKIEQQGAICHSWSWSEAIEGNAIPTALLGDVAFDYVICFPQVLEEAGVDSVTAATRQSESLMTLCRQLLDKEATRQTRLWCVTMQAEKVVDTDDLAGLAQSVMTGVIKCAALEYPGRIGGVVDVEGQQAAVDESETINYVLAHLRQPGNLRYLSIRKGLPYTPQLLPLKQHQQTQTTKEVEQAPQYGGTVLITGGFGGIGSAIATALAAQVDTLVLVGRTIAGQSQRRQLRDLQRAGVKTIAIAADLANPVQVEGVFAQLEKEHIRIDHLIHAAGIGGDRLIGDSYPGDLSDVVSSKLASTWYLHQRAPKDLKSFHVLSSMVGLWGAKGKVHYVLANHFADRVAQLRRGQGLAASVTQLGPVDSGMLNAAGKDAAQRVGVRSFDVHQLAQLLTASLPISESVLVDINWSQFKPVYRDSWLDAYFSQVGADDADLVKGGKQHTGQTFLQQYTSLPGAKRGKFIEAQLFSILREVLGVGGEMVSYLETGFHDLGMDSLLTMQFAGRVAALTGAVVSTIDIFNNANLARLSQWVSTQLKLHIETTLPVVPIAKLNKVQEVQSQTAQPQEQAEVSVEQIENELMAMQEALKDI